MTDLPTFADVQDAKARLEGLVVRTPILRNDALDAVCGGKVLVKAECLQRTGSFKFRGAYNRLCRLDEAQRRAGVVAFSSGNHAQGVAAAAQMLGLPATIVMPADAPAVKVEATRSFGAEIVFYDRFTQSREAIAAELAQGRGAVVVPSYDDPFIIAGQGTCGLEAVSQMAEIGERADVLLCPASGGGFMAGLALVFGERAPDTRLYVVEPKGFEDHAESLKAGHPVPVTPPGPSLCDALLAPQPGALTFAVNGSRLSGALAATDEEALAAMAFAFRHLKVVLEPGGAVALAAMLNGKLPLDGATALVIASGGNVDPAVYCRALGA